MILNSLTTYILMDKRMSMMSLTMLLCLRFLNTWYYLWQSNLEAAYYMYRNCHF